MLKLNKKILSVLMITIMLLSSLYNTCIVSASEIITVKLNGIPLSFDVPPQMINDRVLVPLRKIFEAMGADVDWDDATQTVIATKDNTVFKMTIGSNEIYINEASKTIDVPACIIDGRTLAPTRAIAEAFNSTVKWIDKTNTVEITTTTPVNYSKGYLKLIDVIKKYGTQTKNNNEYEVKYYPFAKLQEYSSILDGSDSLKKPSTSNSLQKYYMVFKYNENDHLKQKNCITMTLYQPGPQLTMIPTGDNETFGIMMIYNTAYLIAENVECTFVTGAENTRLPYQPFIESSPQAGIPEYESLFGAALNVQMSMLSTFLKDFNMTPADLGFTNYKK